MAKDVDCRIIMHKGNSVLGVPFDDACDCCLVGGAELHVESIIIEDKIEVRLWGKIPDKGPMVGEDAETGED